MICANLAYAKLAFWSFFTASYLGEKKWHPRFFWWMMIVIFLKL